MSSNSAPVETHTPSGYGSKQAFLIWGRGRVAPLAFSLPLLFDQPGAECHPGEDSTCLYLCPLCQSLVGLIVVEADGVSFPVNPTNITASILRMPDHCLSLEPQAPGPATRLADTTFGRFH